MRELESSVVFDQQIFNPLIEAMGDEGRDLVRNLIEVYIAEAMLLIERIAHAVASGAAEQLARDAHKLRGSSLSMGANTLAERCTALEDHGLGGIVGAEAHGLYRQAAEELERLRNALLAYRHTV